MLEQGQFMIKHGFYWGDIIYNQVAPEPIIVPEIWFGTYIFIFPKLVVYLWSHVIAGIIIISCENYFYAYLYP